MEKEGDSCGHHVSPEGSQGSKGCALARGRESMNEVATSGTLGGRAASLAGCSLLQVTTSGSAHGKTGQGESLLASVEAQKVSTHQGKGALANGLGGWWVGQGRDQFL